jgi:lecithin:retinol acyltransferase
MVSPRRGYTHHGIYVGGGRVVQYGGLCRGLRRGPVEEVVVSQFAQGRSIYVRLADSRRFGSEEVVRRARSRLGENSYNVITNNCEHFCEWCVHGEHQSYQVGNLLTHCSKVWRGVVEFWKRCPGRSSEVFVNTVMAVSKNVTWTFGGVRLRSLGRPTLGPMPRRSIRPVQDLRSREQSCGHTSSSIEPTHSLILLSARNNNGYRY